ncbi:SH3 domain-containing kinase-binding protein 1 isoform X3 [Seriola lalandi dorsalis]|uniref:SH3 domain-containing kinase-binding protein 1 isoform X3 n=1 Tax=Seriola lalandi dorsalis TaxID=1841481 RepID=UPI000C6FA5A1|nr:SH3 domain-containing kinase-binding protein 1 isoform X3 [Seriola lalandi dorsalis]XP_056219810.1 SH3 domain-containing kinase-binding protein 1 isoform X2 [Seriola aureovittata]
MVEAVVEFDYEAQQDDELSLTVGDIIVNIRRDDGGWWEGELGGRRGLFPDNFVREIKKEAKRDGGQASMIRSDLANGRASPVSDPGVRPGRKGGDQIRKRRCKAAFSYVPQHEDELELKIGDVIEIIAEVEEGWWEGVLNGKTGMFPSNFTKEILKESDTPSVDTPTPQEEVRSARTSKDSPGSESDGGDSRSETGSGEIQPKKVRGFGFGDIFKDQPIKLRPRSMEIDSEVDKINEGKAAGVAPETMKTEPDSKAKGRELCKVLFPYEAQNEDELTIKEGEIINIITKECADAGWWMGEIGGRQGVFPDNFVKLLEVEKERPKKPPPPSAPSAKHTTDVDLDAVVASTEKLSHPTASRPRVTDRRPRSQIITSSSLSITDLDSPVVEDRKERGKEEQEPVPPRSVDVSQRKGVPTISANDSKAPLPTKPSVLTPPNAGHRPASPSSSLGLSPSPELRHSPLTSPTLEELRNQLRDLRTSVEQLKNQHRQEMKHLASALDEEKKIRVNLQLEVDHIKKNLSK